MIGVWRIAKAILHGGLVGGMLGCASTLIITFVPVDNWLSRIFDPQLATQITITALATLAGAALGGVSEMSLIVLEAYSNSRRK